MMKRIALVLSLLLVRVAVAQVVNDSEIRGILVDRIDTRHQGVGIVVGVIEPAGRRVIAYGRMAVDDKRPVGGDTIFEIGSATKVFTSLLLADAVKRGEVALTDPVAKYLPAGVKVPERGGKKITLVDLATHTSGLPFMPSNLAPKNPANPYADYTVQQLYDFLSTYELPRDIGSQYEYSNLGVGLLGQALSRRAGMDYETLVRSRITGPLGMKSTSITLSEEQKRRLAVGHGGDRERVANWDLPAFAGAGAIRSTANDLLTFLAANLGYSKSSLAAAMAAQLAVRRPTPDPGLHIALGWHIFAAPGGHEIVWHNGGTGGYRSFIGFDAKNRVGVVVLSNMNTSAGVDDIGRHLLDPTAPLMEAPKAHKEIEANPKLFDGYAGRYELAPAFILTVTRDGGQLFVQATDQPRFEVFPESDRDYFFKVVDARITFQVDEKGRATALVLHQNGRDVPGKRIEGEAAAPKVNKQVTLDPTILDRYVGRYMLIPTFILTVTREENHLYAQATGQEKFEIFAKSEREFFYTVVDAQITFETDATGRATKLILHQNGIDQPAALMK